MYCYKCGKEIPDGSRFCHFCGAQQEEYDTPPRNQTAETTAPNQTVSHEPVGGASTGGSAMLEDMRSRSIRSSVAVLMIGVVITVIVLVLGGPIVGLSTGIVTIPLFGWPAFRAIGGSYQQEVRDFLAKTGSYEEAERFYFHTAPIQGVCLGPEFVYFQAGRKNILLRPWDVAWVYQHITTHYALFIPMMKSRCVIVRTMGGKSYSIAPTSKEKIETLLKAMQEALPGTVFGYNINLEKAYKENRQAFAARWEEKVPGCLSGYAPM